MKRIARAVAASLTAAATAAAVAVPAGADPGDFGPQAPRNPATAPPGGATMHGDSASSKVFTGPGPGAGPHLVTRVALGAVCPTLLHGRDGMPVALCTSIVDRAPVVHLLDPVSGKSVASLPVARGSLLGGVYAYLDAADRLVLIDGNRDLLRISHRRGPLGRWSLRVAERRPLAGHIAADDAVTAVAAGYDRRVWFATVGGVVGTVDTGAGAVSTYRLPDGEQIHNSVSTAPGGRTAVVSTHALYLFGTSAAGAPTLWWRHAYDRGPARKPGQLSWGSGATPVFFGPTTGTDYVTITDNARPHVRAEVVRADTGQQVCAVPLFTDQAASGTENAPLAGGRSVFVVNTYGYPYPAVPAGTPPADPPSAPFAGGMARLDVRADGSGCDLRWTNRAASAALPRLSLADAALYTVVQDGPLDTQAAPLHFAAVDAHTGAVTGRTLMGGGLVDPLQMAGTALGRTYLQGTVTGVTKVTPLP